MLQKQCLIGNNNLQHQLNILEKQEHPKSVIRLLPQEARKKKKTKLNPKQAKEKIKIKIRTESKKIKKLKSGSSEDQ